MHSLLHFFIKARTFSSLSVLVLSSFTPVLAGSAVAGGLEQFTPSAVARGSEMFIKAYDPLVRSVALVAPASAGTASACGTRLNNQFGEAFYCTKDKTIYISSTTLTVVSEKFGLAAVAALVSHEYAHARQHALTGFLSSVAWSSVFDELQADCIAGVYMRDAAPFKLGESQIEQAKDFMASIGDYEILDQDWHGTPDMRVLAYSLGYNGGTLGSCAASNNFNFKEILKGNPSGVNEFIDRIPTLFQGF